MQSPRQGRIQILKPDEIDELYCRPAFSQAEREEYFSLDSQILEHIRTLGRLETRIYFILLLGYFRTKPVIPRFHMKDVRADVEPGQPALEVRYRQPGLKPASAYGDH